MAQKTPGSIVFDFPAHGNVKRHVVVQAAPQVVKGRRVPVAVTAARFRQPPKPPEGKGIVRVIEVVIDLVVQPITDNKITLHTFNPPLKIAIEVPTGIVRRERKLHIFTTFRDRRGRWRWEKLKTDTRRREGRTILTAEIRTLHPGDPEGIGSG